MPFERGSGITPEVEAFLKESRRGFLLTLRRDGSPTSHPMTAVFSGGRLTYNAYRKSVKATNVDRDPRTCSLVLFDYESAPKYAVVYKGSAHPLAPSEFEVESGGAIRTAGAVDGSISERASARLAEGKRVLLSVDAEEVAFLGGKRG